MKKIILFSALPVFLYGVFAFAENGEAVDSNWSVSASAGKQKQSIAKSTSELTSFNLDVAYQKDNWDFYIDAPWYKSQGNYYLGGVRSRLIARCEKILSLTPLQQKNRIKNGNLTQTKINACERIVTTLNEINATHEGVGDVTGFAHYNFLLDDAGTWNAIFGVGYKSNTGDESVGLGSGTNDILIESGLGFDYKKISASLTLGYDVVSGDSSEDNLYTPQNYGYVNANATYKMLSWLNIGFSGNTQQAYVEQGDSVSSTTAFVDFLAGEYLNLHVFTTHYNGGANTPDNEIGASVRYSF